MLMKTRAKSRKAGFTLIELLIVIAILGMIAAMLIPSMIEALHKSRQKRTMGSLRDFGFGVASYWTDNGGAAAAGQATVTVGDWQGTATVDDLQTALVPDYIPAFPSLDGWGNPIEFHVVLDAPPRSGYALVRSPAKDGIFEADTYTPGSFEPSDYDQDIVWADGGFVRAPDSA